MAAVIAAFVSLAHAQGPNGPQSAPRPAQIDRNGVLILIRQSLLALDQANKTGNYTVLRAAVNGQWRLFGISVALGRTEPVAPSPPSPPPEAANAPKHAPQDAPAPKPAPALKPTPKP